MAGLPPIVRALAELSPVEDILLYVLRQGLPGVRVQSLIADRQDWPMVLVRRLASFGEWSGDERFIDQADIAVQAFAQDPDGDSDAALLAEKLRRRIDLERSHREQQTQLAVCPTSVGQPP